MSWHDVTLVVWGALFGLGAVVELSGQLSRGRLCTIDRAVGVLVARRTARVALLVGWMWLGWHAFAR